MRTELARSALFGQFLRAAVKDIRDDLGPSPCQDKGCQLTPNALDSIEQVAEELEAIATAEGPSAEARAWEVHEPWNAEGAGGWFITVHRNYRDVERIVRRTASARVVPLYESVAPSAEPSDAEMLDWVMENTDAGYRNGTNHGVHWVDGRAWHWTEGVDYEDAIRAAMQEEKAIAAAANA